MAVKELVAKLDLWKVKVEFIQELAYDLLEKTVKEKGEGCPESLRLTEALRHLRAVEIRVRTLSLKMLNGIGLLDLEEALKNGDEALKILTDIDPELNFSQDGI